ncbi:MAG: hypothetical protein A2W19_09785 [Spirochaetes bacterium RBG_16_49_21]|nr:MAG: hypothetical protein A2W19_09785 [Spirochaetes bacterium RBG_16_49_21]
MKWSISVPTPSVREVRFSLPMRKLADEHVTIKRFIALIPGIVQQLNEKKGETKEFVSECVDFIRSYADRYHHSKEEDVWMNLEAPSENTMSLLKNSNQNLI